MGLAILGLLVGSAFLLGLFDNQNKSTGNPQTVVDINSGNLMKNEGN